MLTKIRRIGIIGFGMIAEGAHCPALRSVGVEVAAVFDPMQRSREAARRRAPKARVYDRLNSLLAGEKSLDALIVCSPPKFHAEAVVAGLNADLHVLCEKPLTLDPAAFVAIRSAARAANRCVYSINNWSFSPQWSRLLKISASGRLGAIRRAEIRVLRTKPSLSTMPGSWRKDPAVSGGGILVDHGWHSLYLMRRLLGDKLELAETILYPIPLPRAVGKRPPGVVDEVVTVLLKAPGASGAIHLSWRAGERSNSAFVAGEKGTVELRDDRMVVKTEGLDETTRFPDKLSAGSAHPGWLAAMWPAFEAECLGRGRGDNLAEAAFCLRTIRQAYDHAIPRAVGGRPARA